jgi:putative oxidoreductase
MAEGRSHASFSFAGEKLAARMQLNEDLGKLILRLSVAVLILLHGIAKIRYGLGDVIPALARHNIPQAVGYTVLLGEVVAPVLMIIGLWTRPAAWLLAATMAAALVLGHARELFQMTNHGGLLLEVQWMYFTGAVAVALLGAGRFSVGGVTGRWN